MKKSIVLAILGIAGATASYGQGYVNFLNYFGSTSPTIGYNTNPAAAPFGKAGLALGGSFAAELFWYNGVTDNPTLLSAIPSTITYFSFNGPSANSTPDGDTADGAGWFIGPTATLTGYTSGQVTLEVWVFNSSFSGVSPFFLMTPATGITPVPSFPTSGPDSYQNFAITLIPEPGMLVFGALGGLGLLLFRRKQM
jgi:hypothetical protein